ncbi:Na(+)/H(+) exchanger beta-like [Lineus longissimus]|uniref:Na(+)/H(+) exchanger beta-like n=1 Tax=Lineus longissimus TaxID=88925 RepID=UPI002B4ED26E
MRFNWFRHFTTSIVIILNFDLLAVCGSDVTGTENVTEHDVSVHVAGWNFAYVELPLLVCLFLFGCAISKIIYHHANFLASWIPESCILILLGVITGVIFFLTEHDELNRVFTPTTFFLYLLPPIILESAYSLHDRTFVDNLGSILLFAVVGTVLNWAIIGPALYSLSLSGAMGEINIGLVQCLTFSALIVAVDPVAVIAIFQDIGVNNMLYFLVFGESLLNDAVTVVLYNMMNTFVQMDSIPLAEIGKGFASFFTVSLGGLVIGLIFGLVTAFLLKFTSDVRVVEPLFVFILAYLSYLVAELFHLSALISLIACGIMQAQYAFHNISHKSYTTVKYFIKMMSAISEAVIFLFLGMALVKADHEWHTGFVLWTLLIIFIVRFFSVFLLTFIANSYKGRMRKINPHEQFIMAYGGLRGAVSFSLAAMLPSGKAFLPQRDLFLTTTLVVVLCTVFIQGITVKPLVQLLKIKKANIGCLSVSQEVHTHVQDHMMAGIEEIIGRRGNNFWRTFLDHVDEKYLKSWLQREPMRKVDKIMATYEKIALKQHFASLPGSKVANDFYIQQQEKKKEKICQAIAGANPPEFAGDDGTPFRPRAKTIGHAPATEKTPMIRRRSRIGRHPRSYSTRRSAPAEEPIDKDELRKILSWRPAADLHQTFDRNLYSEDDQDLEQQLRYKRMLASWALRSYSTTQAPEEDSYPNNSNQERNPRSRNRGAPKPALFRMNTMPTQDNNQTNRSIHPRSMSVDVAPAFEMDYLGTVEDNGNVNEGCVFSAIAEENEAETSIDVKL